MTGTPAASDSTTASPKLSESEHWTITSASFSSAHLSPPLTASNAWTAPACADSCCSRSGMSPCSSGPASTRWTDGCVARTSAMRRAEQIEPLDAMHAAEEQHDERAGRDAEPRAIAADGALRRIEVDAVGHDRDRHAEPEIADRVGLLFGRRMQQRRAFQIAALEQRVRHRLPPAAAPHRLRLQHAARRDHVRHAMRARKARRRPLRHVPHAVDVADVGAGERGRQRPSQARAEKPLRECRRHVADRHAVVLAAGRTPSAAAVFAHWRSWSRLRRRCRRAGGPGTSRGSRPAVRRTAAPAQSRATHAAPSRRRRPAH